MLWSCLPDRARLGRNLACCGAPDAKPARVDVAGRPQSLLPCLIGQGQPLPGRPAAGPVWDKPQLAGVLDRHRQVPCGVVVDHRGRGRRCWALAWLVRRVSGTIAHPDRCRSPAGGPGQFVTAGDGAEVRCGPHLGRVVVSPCGDGSPAVRLVADATLLNLTRFGSRGCRSPRSACMPCSLHSPEVWFVEPHIPCPSTLTVHDANIATVSIRGKVAMWQPCHNNNLANNLK